MKTYFLILIAVNFVVAWRGYKILLLEMNITEVNKDYVQDIKAGIRNGTGFAQVHMKKDLRQPIYVQFQVYQKIKDKYDHLVIDGSVEVCNILRNPTSNPLFGAIYPALNKKGNLPKKCPIKAGTYVSNDIRLDEEMLPPYAPGEFWKIDVSLLDDAVLVYKTFTIIKIDHSPGLNRFSSFLSK